MSVDNEALHLQHALSEKSAEHGAQRMLRDGGSAFCAMQANSSIDQNATTAAFLLERTKSSVAPPSGSTVTRQLLRMHCAINQSTAANRKAFANTTWEKTTLCYYVQSDLPPMLPIAEACLHSATAQNPPTTIHDTTLYLHNTCTGPTGTNIRDPKHPHSTAQRA